MLDGGSMFGVIPKTLWQQRISADERNCIPMMMRLMLIQGEGKNILVDAGSGNKYSEKFNTIYSIEDSLGSLEKGLAENNLSFSDITDVIITHLHFDHAGGSTIISGKEIVPTFPNARYYVQKSQFEWAKNPIESDRASYFANDFEPLIKNNKLIILNGAKDICPGVSVQVTNGHTSGQQHVIVSDGKVTIFYCADLIPTSAHLGIPWNMSYDHRLLLTIEEKKTVLKKASEEGWVLFFEHCPIMAAATVRMGKKDYEIAEEVKI